MDKKAFNSGMAMLIEVFGGELSALKLSAYEESLSDINNSAWQYGIKQSLRVCKFFPKPSELLEFAREYQSREWLKIKQLPRLPEPDPATPEQLTEIRKQIGAIISKWDKRDNPRIATNIHARKREGMQHMREAGYL